MNLFECSLQNTTDKINNRIRCPINGKGCLQEFCLFFEDTTIIWKAVDNILHGDLK